MKKIGLIFFAIGLSVVARADKNPKYLNYIEQWREMALLQEQEYGIPASITLAQGLLESSAGESELAKNANNHFGIKCTSDWMGGNYYHDDDAKNDCFRVYNDAGESYRDHSLFLQRSRYKTCFELPITDYAGWARRLRECGYATDPQYAQKLIRIIEDYDLANLPIISASGDSSNASSDASAESSSESSSTSRIGEDGEDFFRLEAEVAPLEKPLSAYKEKQLLLLQHPKHTCNGRAYFVAKEGDTYANLAFRLNVRERSLRKWNDALGRTLRPGDRVYYKFYKRSFITDKEKYVMWVHPGESVWTVSQREGIKASKIRKLNGWGDDVNVFSSRQKILLHKVKE